MKILFLKSRPIHFELFLQRCIPWNSSSFIFVVSRIYRALYKRVIIKNKDTNILDAYDPHCNNSYFNVFFFCILFGNDNMLYYSCNSNTSCWVHFTSFFLVVPFDFTKNTHPSSTITEIFSVGISQCHWRCASIARIPHHLSLGIEGNLPNDQCSGTPAISFGCFISLFWRRCFQYWSRVLLLIIYLNPLHEALKRFPIDGTTF
jgi:hypothetical protein